MKRYALDELIVTTKERPKVVAAPVLPPYEGLERAGDHFKRVHTVESVLELLGFHSPEVDSQGTHWVRPGKEPGAGTSATVFKDAPDKVTIWSSTCTQMWPALQVNTPYDAFSLLAVTNYGGDFSRAAEFLRTEGYGYEEEERNSNRLLDDLKAFVALQGERLEQEQDDGIQGTGWRRIRLSLERYKTPPPPPDIFQRADDTCLLYRRRIHYFYGPPECIAGSGKVRVELRDADGRRRSSKTWTLEHLWARFHREILPGRGNYPRRATADAEFYVSSMNEETGQVSMNQVKDVVDVGVKEVFCLTTEGGRSIDATADHLFSTPDGYRPLADLGVGDKVYFHPRKPAWAGGRLRAQRRDIEVKYHPSKHTRVINGCTYYRVRMARAVYEARRNGMSFEEYRKVLNTADRETIDRLWTVPAGYEVHHRDGDHRNDSPDNLELLTVADHDRVHIEETSRHIAVYAEADIVSSVVPSGHRRCYDLVMAAPWHNFVVNGLIVHNCGKSWAAQVATAWAVLEGKEVVYIDFENDPWSFRERMRSLGVTADATMDLVAYFNPSGRYSDEEFAEFKRQIQRAELVVVDGVSNGMNLFGYNPMEHKGAVDFEMNFLRPLTAGGAAVVAIDHAPKNTDGVASSVFGAQHKKAAVTGAMFRFQIVKPFGRGLKGIAALYLEKDKPGFLRQHTEQKGLIAELVLESLSDGTVSARLNTPTIGGERPTKIMESLSRYLEHPVRRDQGCTLAELRTKGTYSTNVKWVQKAIEFLLEDGFAQRETNGKIRWKRSYRENAELNPYIRPRLPAAPIVAPPSTPVPGQLLEAPQLPMELSIDDDSDDIYMSAMHGELF